MEVSINTGQVKILEDFFHDLSDMDQRKIWLSAFRKASRPLVAAAKTTVPRRSGDLAKSIGMADVPDKTAIHVGSFTNYPHAVKRKGKWTASKTWYGWVVEKGSFRTGERHWRNGKSTGIMPASNFFENAYYMAEDQVFGSIEKEWYNKIDVVIRNTKRKLR